MGGVLNVGVDPRWGPQHHWTTIAPSVKRAWYHLNFFLKTVHFISGPSKWAVQRQSVPALANVCPCWSLSSQLLENRRPGRPVSHFRGISDALLWCCCAENRSRVHVKDGVQGCCNCRRLIAMLKGRFVEAGGVVMERTSFRSAECGKDGVLIRCAPGRFPRHATL